MSRFRGSLHDEQDVFDLPVLPSVIRYYDDFQDKYHSILNLKDSNTWKIYNDGKSVSIDFNKINAPFRDVYKHVAADLFSRLDTTSVLGAMRGLIKYQYLFLKALTCQPHEYREIWTSSIVDISPGYGMSVRAAIHSLCNLSFGPWSPDLHEYVSGFPSQKLDIYKTVRTRDCFVPLDQQSLMIDYIDEIVIRLNENRSFAGPYCLRDACILVISHQYGLRPGQIARIKSADIRIHETGSVHFSFPLTKQRGTKSMRLVSRRIKREWCNLFIKYSEKRRLLKPTNDVPADNYFLLDPAGVSFVISDLTEKLTGVKWTPMELRHTAAQRLADAGASHIVLAEFMGHATTLTANVYFDASPTQAQRINQALALSSIYANVAEVARTKTIDKAALLRLPSDKQIGGVPHGIPISGIGGCESGQSLCAKNPILSCYTCRKFMPLADASIHESVVESLRPIVIEFSESSRSNEVSPAYTQLRRMFLAAQQVVSDIKTIEDTCPDQGRSLPDE